MDELKLFIQEKMEFHRGGIYWEYDIYSEILSKIEDIQNNINLWNS